MQFEMNGVNPVLTVLGSIATGIYSFVGFLNLSLTALVSYLTAEISAIMYVGFSSIVTLVALVTLPLITPIA